MIVLLNNIYLLVSSILSKTKLSPGAATSEYYGVPNKITKNFFYFYLLYPTLLHIFVPVHTGKALSVGTFY